MYSIASSHDAHPGLVELTVGIVRFSYHGRDRGGLATQFMADEIGNSDQKVGVFMSPTKSFVLPDDKDTDIIMVGPGTGIAPFRAFMEQRGLMVARVRIGCSLVINHRRPNFIIRTQLNHGLIAAICTVLRLHGQETKQRRYTSNIG